MQLAFNLVTCHLSPVTCTLLRDEPIEPAAIRGRKGNFIMQVGEIERGRVYQRHPIRRGQIQILLQDEIRRRYEPRQS